MPHCKRFIDFYYSTENAAHRCFVLVFGGTFKNNWNWVSHLCIVLQLVPSQFNVVNAYIAQVSMCSELKLYSFCQKIISELHSRLSRINDRSELNNNNK